jgi:hypothetical protein
VAGVRLDCPLCGACVSDGALPVPGTCPGCAARYDGGTERPQGAAAAALAAAGIAGDPDRLARGLFDVAAGAGLALTSDRRDGFYAWWVFVANDRTAHDLMATLAR